MESNSTSTRPSITRHLLHALPPFVAGAALIVAFGANSAAQSGGGSQDSTTEYAGPPKVTSSGADSSIQGPPRANDGSAPVQGGYNNPGGMVDAAALQAAAAQGGIHYHVHYHGAPGASGAPGVAGYAPTTFVNPAAVQGGNTAGQYMPGYGPGNPGPLGSDEGEVTQPFVGSHSYTGFSGYGAYGNYFGGPGGYFGGGGGAFPSAMAANAAYANSGFVSGFND